MAQNSAFDVIYEFGNKVLKRDVVIAATGDAATIGAVLVSNGKGTDVSGPLNIWSIKNSLAVPPLSILS